MAGLEHSVVKAMLQTGEYADFKIHCKGTDFKVHKFVLAAGSDFFRCLLRNECKETMQNRVEFPDDDPATIGRLIDYLYLGSYDSEATPVSMRKNEILQPHKKPYQWSPVDSVPFADENKDDGRAPALAALRTEVLVYQASEKYGISSAMSHTLMTIDTSIRHMEWLQDDQVNSIDLAGLLELVLRVTTAGDKLRNLLLKYCIVEFDSLRHGKIVDMIMQHEPSAWLVGRSLQADIDALTVKW